MTRQEREAEAKRLFKERVYQDVGCAQEGGLAEVRLPDRTKDEK